MTKKKLAVIVPYRDRVDQLRHLIRGLGEYFHGYAMHKRGGVKNFIPTLYVIEQKDTKDFNRGKLLNIGFLAAEADGADYVVFHDIDMLPLNVDYNYSDKPLQMANQFETNTKFSRTINDDYFGGVTLFNIENFRKINGYSNKYRGWGFEDNDLLYRCKKNDVDLDTLTYKSYSEEGKALSFNGKNSLVEIPNRFTYARPISFYVSFYPSNIKCNNDEITDEFAVFGVPGEDLNLSYNSFRTYKFEAFLSSKEAVSITSKTLPNMPCRAVVTLDSRNKQMHFYLNGYKVGRNLWKKFNIKNYTTEKLMYLGVGDPKRKLKQKWFTGNIDEFAVFDKVLNNFEARELCLKEGNYLNENFGRYEGAKNLKTYYRVDHSENTEDILVDLSGNNNNAQIKNCKIVKKEYISSTTIDVPHKRRGRYRLLPHEEKGYTLGYWKNWKSRINQLRYYDIINNNKEEYLEDGLTSCRYKVLSEKQHPLGDIYRINTKVISVRS